MTQELSLPNSPEAERAVIGAAILDEEALLEVADKVRPEDFYVQQHAILWREIISLHSQQAPIDLITLTDRLREVGELERVGGASYVSGLLDSLPDVSNAAHYAKIVRDKAVKRRLMKSAQKVLAACSMDKGEAEEAVQAAQAEISAIADEAHRGGLTRIGALADAEARELERAQAEGTRASGIETGFYALNNLTGGLQPKDLIILAGRPSMGKTALAVNICAHAALHGMKRVAIFSLEMSAEQLTRRILSAETGIQQARISGALLSKQEWSRLMLTVGALGDAPLWIDDTPGITVLEMLAKAKRLKREGGLDLVMVDYMQLMSGGRRFSSRNEEVSAISRALKAAAKELEVPVLALSQLSRQPERRGGDYRPRLSDLRESGAIEQDADLVLFLFRPVVYDPAGEDPKAAKLIIAKQRNGPTGDIDLVFNHATTKFENPVTPGMD